MSHEVFICYASHDKHVAEAVCATLESRHIQCWIAPRDVLPGTEWAESIVDALDGSRIVVLVLSSNSNSSPQVTREVGKAASNDIPIIPLRIDDVPPSKAMGFFISSHHWLDAQTPPLEKHLQRLADTVQQLLTQEVEKGVRIAGEKETKRAYHPLGKSVEHLEKGLKLEREGNLKGAKYNLLKAAEFLYKAAEKSKPSLKSKRIERADSILRRTDVLTQVLAGKTSAGSITRTESTEATSEWMVFEKPHLRLDDVAGLEEVKEQIRIRMIYPFTHPDLAKRFGIKKGGGILLYGPPGTGKTMLAKAVAGEIDAAFFTVKPSEIMSKWVGEAEQNVARLFSEARKHERVIIFIDEVESLIPRRSGSHSTVMQRVVPQILSEMEGFSSGRDSGKALLFMGATNEPWALDKAVLRPGRFDEKVYVPLPDFAARFEILYSHLKDKPLSPDISLEETVQMLEGYSGADIRHICEKACDIPFVESVKTGEERDVEKRDLLSVMQQVKPSVSRQAIEKFERLAFSGEW